MKHKIFMAKVLTIGILLNSLSILSYANTEISNRYQTLEGEFITIDDSTEGELVEIEVFGNTIQDENDLSDIQSVGDLYVDENGNPILDKQGRKQYKIEIVSSNLIPSSISFEEFSTLTPSNIQGFTAFPIDNIEYVIAKLNDDSILNPSSLGIKIYHTKLVLGEELKIIPDSTLEHCLPFYNWSTINSSTGKEDILEALRLGHLELSIKIKDKPLIYNNLSGLSESNKTIILLPTQLQKVGNIADRLYWDSEKGKYLIEKNVDTFKLEELGPYEVTTYGALKEYWSYTWNDVGLLRGYKYQSPIISNYNTTNKDKTYLNYWTNHLRLLTKPGIVKEGAVSADDMTLADYLDYANTNNIFNPDTVVMILREKPIYIDTNITSKLKLPTYNENTHIYANCENGINPILKVTIDRLFQIAKNSVKEAEINSSVNNISLARMYVNMLPESLYKDQLQDQLNNLFSSEMALDIKTATANLDLYIKSQNALIMSLNTNNITFKDFSGVEDTEKVNAVEITINSSLPYSLNAYLPTEIQNADKTNIMDKRILNIKENSESVYQAFANTTDKIVLKDNCNAGNDLIHNIDIKLKGGIAHQKDVYKTTIKFEAQQK